ncbi:MAG: hypothetical protein QW063_02320, partial [Candidatus Nanoarchaeia archaeon]
MRRYWLQKQKLLLFAIIALIFILFSVGQLTGFFTAESWTHSKEITVDNSIQTITEHIIFDSDYLTERCSDNIFVMTTDFRTIPFKTTNEVYNSNNLCIETDVVFDNIIYQPQPQFGISEMQQSITYVIYYGKIIKPTVTAEEHTLEIQPEFQTQQTNISSCTTISSPGYYVLTQNITDSGATYCINIASNNVIFDGQGYTIDGIDTSNTYGIYVYDSAGAALSLPSGFKTSGVLTNVTVKNVILTDWNYGVVYNNGQNGTITNVTATSNALGIY